MTQASLYQEYTTQYRDRLDRIAALYRVSLVSLVRANPSLGIHRFKPTLPAGETLIVPKAAQASRVLHPAPPWRTVR